MKKKVDYLKKTKMHELAKTLCPDVPALRYCEYKFYRGSEWLKWCADEECEDGYIGFELYNCPGYHSLDKVQYLDSEFKAVGLERKVYPHVNNQVLQDKNAV